MGRGQSECKGKEYRQPGPMTLLEALLGERCYRTVSKDAFLFRCRSTIREGRVFPIQECPSRDLLYCRTDAYPGSATHGSRSHPVSSNPFNSLREAEAAASTLQRSPRSLRRGINLLASTAQMEQGPGPTPGLPDPTSELFLSTEGGGCSGLKWPKRVPEGTALLSALF